VPPAPDRSTTLDMLNSKFRVAIDSSTNALGLRRAPSVLPRAWVVHADTMIADDSAAAAFMRSPRFDPRKIAVLDSVAPVRVLVDGTGPDDSVAVTSRSTNAMTVHARDGSYRSVLVLSEIWYPGWTATVDGKPTRVIRADWTLRGVVLPPGNLQRGMLMPIALHEIVFRFAPRSFQLGACISIATILLALGIALALYLNRARSMNSPPPS
jgi:hypothetical protein